MLFLNLPYYSFFMQLHKTSRKMTEALSRTEETEKFEFIYKTNIFTKVKSDS